ncbi:MAG: hypothetical protein ACOC8H_00305 [bacterium]
MPEHDIEARRLHTVGELLVNDAWQTDPALKKRLRILIGAHL